jgi:hypothetical protein
MVRIRKTSQVIEGFLAYPRLFEVGSMIELTGATQVESVRVVGDAIAASCAKAAFAKIFVE